MAITKNNLGYYYLIFFITPVLGLIYGLKNGSLKTIRWSIFAFTVFYGSLFTFPILGSELGGEQGKGYDGAVHWNHVYSHYQYLDFTQWWNELLAIITLNPSYGSYSDPYAHVLAYFIGGVLNAPQFFFVGVAIVFGYFYSGAFVKIISYINWTSGYNKFYFIFFTVLFVLWNLPSDMQTVRTWTGMWVLIYAVLSYYDTKKWKYLVLALFPLLIHFGYAVLGLGIWIVLFSGYRNPKVYFIIFIISMLVSNFVLNSGFNDLASQTELGASKVQGYYSDDERQAEREEKNAKLASGSNFYKSYETLGIHHYVLTGVIVFVFIFLRKNGFGKIENMLFSYALAQASVANLFVSIFAAYNRGWVIAGVFIIALMMVFLSKQKINNIRFSFLKVKLPLFIISLAIFPYMLYFLSSFLDTTSVFIFFLPFISWFEPDVGISIRDILVLFL